MASATMSKFDKPCLRARVLSEKWRTVSRIDTRPSRLGEHPARRISEHRVTMNRHCSGPTTSTHKLKSARPAIAFLESVTITKVLKHWSAVPQVGEAGLVKITCPIRHEDAWRDRAVGPNPGSSPAGTTAQAVLSLLGWKQQGHVA